MAKLIEWSAYDPTMITDADRAWLAANLFRVDPETRHLHTDVAVMLSVDTDTGLYDQGAFARGTELRPVDQCRAIGRFQHKHYYRDGGGSVIVE